MAILAASPADAAAWAQVTTFADTVETWDEAPREALAALIKALPFWTACDMADSLERVVDDLTATCGDDEDAAQDALDAVCDYADAAGIALT